MLPRIIPSTPPPPCVPLFLIVFPGSLGTMGVGLPFAIGAQFAFPDQTCIVIDGDGSFNMTNSELYSIAKYNLPVKVSCYFHT